VITALVLFQLAAVSAPVPGQVDSICREGKCEIVTVQKGRVRRIDQWRDLDLGKYAVDAQHLIPSTEAPVSDLRSARGWRVVASVYFEHGEDDIRMNIRFFGPDRKLRLTDEGLYFLLEAEIGNLFGGNDEIFAITSTEEHAYNVLTNIWLLPERGEPKVLIEDQGTFGKFSGRVVREPGVTTHHQTYDGVNADTKGLVQQFYAWDSKRKLLTLKENSTHTSKRSNRIQR